MHLHLKHLIFDLTSLEGEPYPFTPLPSLLSPSLPFPFPSIPTPLHLINVNINTNNMASTTFSFDDDSSGSEHEHWPEDFKPAAVVAEPGYDNQNGLRMHNYHPPTVAALSIAPSSVAPPSTKAASPSPSPPPSPEKSVKAAALTDIFTIQYAYPAQEPIKMATQTQAYVSIPVPVTAAPATVAPATVTPASEAPATVAAASVAPASVAASAKTAAPKASEPVPNTHVYIPKFTEKPAEAANEWLGRTKAQVDVDNTKIAADEKVWEKRKVVPTGLPDDQMCWVVEADASYTLR